MPALEAAMIFAGRKPFGTGFAQDAIPQLYLAAAHQPALRPTGEAFLLRMAAPLAIVTGPHDTALTLARCLTGLIIHELARGGERPSDILQADVALPDLTGQRALVTAASDGMGVIMATRLAGAGAGPQPAQGRSCSRKDHPSGAGCQGGLA